MSLLPAGFRLVVDPGVRRLGDGGRVLLGGSPLRVLRLTEPGARMFDRWTDGAPVAAGLGARRLAARLVDSGLAHPRPVAGGGPSPADVTVIVPIHGAAAGLGAQLESLREAGVAEIVVVDDASAELDAARIRNVVEDRGALLLRRPVNGGPGAARVTGLLAVRTPFVAFVDADVVLDQDWLVSLLAHLADERVVAVAPRVRSLPGGSSVRERYEASYSPLDLGAAEARVAPRTTVAYVPTATLVARTSAIEAAGGFDPGLRFGEDVDLIWRLINAGGAVRYVAEVVVQHRPRRSWGAWARQRFGYGTAAAPLAERHPGQVPPVAVSGWSAMAWIATAAGHPLVGLGIAGASGALLPAKLKDAVPDHLRESARLAGWGHLHAGRWLGKALIRPWWPLTLALALLSRRFRWVALAAATIPQLLDRADDDGLNAAQYVAIRLADDVAYGAGVWAGCLRCRSVAALVPDLSNWPGRGKLG